MKAAGTKYLVLCCLNSSNTCCSDLPRLCSFLLLVAAQSQGLSEGDVRVDTLYPAREAARLEVQRLCFEGFLASACGQNFVMNAVQDGTLESTQVKQHYDNALPHCRHKGQQLLENTHSVVGQGRLGHEDAKTIIATHRYSIRDQCLHLSQGSTPVL